MARRAFFSFHVRAIRPENDPAVEYDRLPGRASPDLFTREIGKPERLLSKIVRASG